MALTGQTRSYLKNDMKWYKRQILKKDDERKSDRDMKTTLKRKRFIK